MRKGHRIYTIILAALALLLAACQPTPKNDIVAGKDQSSMIDHAAQNSQIAQTSQDELNTLITSNPQKYSFYYASEDGKLNILADAVIKTPESDKIPMAYNTITEFSQDNIYNILNYLYGDTPYYRRQNSGEDEILTKTEIEDELVSLRADIANGKYEGEEEIAYDRINELNGMYSIAPNSKDEPILSDGTMWTNGDSNIKYIDVQSFDEITGLASWFTCTSEGSSPNLRYLSSNESIFSFKDAIRVSEHTKIDDEILSKLGLSLKDAKDIAQSFINASGANDMVCSAAYIINDSGTGLVDGNLGGAKTYAYKLYYTRTVNNVPVVALSEIYPDSDIIYDSWSYERVEITVIKDGIIEIVWKNPCELGEIITDNANIIGFEEAAKIFEHQIIITYEPKAKSDLYENVEINVDNIELGLLRIKKQNSSGDEQGLYVPVWVFFGEVKAISSKAGIDYGCFEIMYNDNRALPEGPYPVLTINAIDGSIIDASLGY